MSKKSLKGLSLIEMIVVLAIIGILMIILVPSMVNYYRGARMKTQNTNARIVFNAAQTISQRYEMQARSLGHVVLEDADTSGGLVIVCQNGTLHSSSPTTPAAGSTLETTYQQFCNRVNNIYSDGDMSTWAVYISNYIVRVSLCAEQIDSGYVGRYPQPLDISSRDTIDLNGSVDVAMMSGQMTGYTW